MGDVLNYTPKNGPELIPMSKLDKSIDVVQTALVVGGVILTALSTLKSLSNTTSPEKS